MIRFRVTRPLWFNGIARQAGDVIDADESAAVELANNNRVELLEARDRDKLKAFVSADAMNAVRKAGPVPRPAGDPWMSGTPWRH